MSPSRARESIPAQALAPEHSCLLDIAEEPPPAVSTVFRCTAPLVIDVGCGKGRFLLARAAAHPYQVFIGIDRQAGRLRKIDHALHRQCLTNVRLLHGDAAALLETWPADAAVSEYFVLFPDPWPKRRHHRRRIMSPAFLETVHRTLCDGGIIHFATDHADYFTQAKTVVDHDKRFNPVKAFMPEESEKTDFELIFTGKGHPVHRASWQKTGT